MSLVREVSKSASFEVPAYVEGKDVLAAGLAVSDHYKSRLSPYRHKLRSYLLPIIRAETPYLAALQSRLRHPWLDTFFVYTANLGTHTAFLVMLPMVFWFGSYSIANALVDILAAGIFISGVMKDFFCLPRPLSPPLRRITMSDTAALEYGLPSSHATNACSVAFYAFALLQDYQGSPTNQFILRSLTVLYVATIIFGRLYCGMHGFADVIVGSLIGLGVSALRWCFQDVIESYISRADAFSTATLIIFIIVLVRLHPEPADPCPCFDDGVAFAGVIIGEYFSFWRFSAETPKTQITIHPGHYIVDSTTTGVWGYTARVIYGIGIIMIWRAVMKSIMLTLLPPLFRALEPIGVIIPRRGFASALLYSRVPKDLPDEVLPGIKEIPSIVRNLRRPRNDSVGPQSAADVYEAVYQRDRQRRLSNDKTMNYDQERRDDSHALHGTIQKPRVRYDVEVITKLVVYAGIGFLAIDFVPWTFRQWSEW